MSLDPVVSWTATLLPTVILAASAVQKLRATDSFRAIVARYELLPRVLVRPFAATLPFIELTLAGALAVPEWHVQAAVAALALIGALTGAMAVNLRRGRYELECGCHFGVTGPSLSRGLLLRNMALMLWLSPATDPDIATRTLGWLDELTMVVATSVGLMAYLSADAVLRLSTAANPESQRSA